MPEIPSSLTRIAHELSERLIGWQCVATDITASGFEVPRWNGLRVMRADVREDFRPFVRPETGMFTQENGVCSLVEQASEGAFLWDELGYASAEYTGRWGVCHFLCDLNAADAILASIARQPIVDAAARDRARAGMIAS